MGYPCSKVWKFVWSIGPGKDSMVRMHRALCTFVVLAASAAAQNVDTSNSESIKQLLQEVEELKAKVQALEAMQRCDDTASTAVTIAPTETATVHTLAQKIHEAPGIQWRGFGEFNYKVLDQKQPELGTFGFVPGSAANFYVGDFDLLLTSRIS